MVTLVVEDTVTPVVVDTAKHDLNQVLGHMYARRLVPLRLMPLRLRSALLRVSPETMMKLLAKKKATTTTEGGK